MLSARALSRIGLCPDRRYGGNLFWIVNVGVLLLRAFGGWNPDRTGAAKPWVPPLIVGAGSKPAQKPGGTGSHNVQNARFPTLYVGPGALTGPYESYS